MRFSYLLVALKKYLRILDSVIHPKKYFIYPKKYYETHKLSFSQEGEDLILNRIFDNQKTGFYVDIGAHHPQRFSNTYHFYLNGWRGINIDAMPGSMELFDKLRPGDINIEIPISNNAEELIYYQFNDPALNGFSAELSEQRNEHEKYTIISKKKLKTEKLSFILDRYAPPVKVIDFMSIDVEGLDFEVLMSNDWAKFRPRFLIVEDFLFKDLKDISDSRIYNFLIENGYSLHSCLVRSFIYMDIKNKNIF